METLRRYAIRTLGVVGGVLLGASPLQAQSPGPVTRVDLAVATGWFAADRRVENTCCSSWSSSLFKGVSGGYYWTDHLKTEVELASPGPTEGYGGSSMPLGNGLYSYTSETHAVTTSRLSLSQAYQFGRNAMFHPFVRTGIDIDRERDDVDRHVSTSGIGNLVEDHRVADATRLRPFVATGFKAYFNEHAFFRGEAKFTPGSSRLDQMAWTAGIGFDFPSGKASGSAASPRIVDPHRTPRAAEPVELWRAYASKLPPGALVDISVAGGEHLAGRLIAAGDAFIDVESAGRVVEPARRIAFDQLEQLSLHTGPKAGSRVGAALAGTGVGAGVFMTLLMLTLSHFGG